MRILDGPHRADIAIVTDWADAGNDSPIVGSASYLLANWLGLQGISRPLCFITHAGLRIKGKYERQFDKLYEELKTCKPKTILALGELSLGALTGLKSISKYRGSVIWNQALGAKVIPTFAPHQVNKNYSYWPLCVSDVGKLKTYSYQAPVHDFIVDAKESHMITLFNEIDKIEAIGIDIETIKDQQGIGYNILDRIGIGAVRFDNSLTQTLSFKVENLTPAVLKMLTKLCDKPRVVIAHNMVYDWVILAYRLKFLPKGKWFDTMIGWHALQPELPKALATVASLMLDTVYWKDENTKNPGKYNCLDVFEMLRIYNEQKNYFKGSGLQTDRTEIFIHMMRLVKPFLYMHLKGLRIDPKAKLAHAEVLTKKISDIQQALEGVNPNSSKQVADYVYDTLGYPKKYKRRAKGGKSVTTDDEALSDLYRKKPHPAIKAILSGRHYRKVLSTYIQAPLWLGRLHSSISPTGTETGRTSSSKGPFGGTNVQNWPNPNKPETKIYVLYKTIRDIVIPDDGYVLVEADLSQAEARFVAWDCGDEASIKRFQDGIDIHSENAKEFNLPRDTAKRLVHSANYIIGARKMGKICGTTTKEGQKALDIYYAKRPQIPRWQNSTYKEVLATRTLTTPFNRVRVFYNRTGTELQRESVAFRPQSSIGDLLNVGLRRLYAKGYEILIQVHDSVLLQIPEGSPKEVLRDIKKTLEIPIQVNGRELIIPADVKVGKNWKDMEKVDV